MLACSRGQQNAHVVPSRSRTNVTHYVARWPSSCTCETFKYHVFDNHGQPWCQHREDIERQACPWTERTHGTPVDGEGTFLDACPLCGGMLEEERQESHERIRWDEPAPLEAIERGLVALPGSSLDPVFAEPGERVGDAALELGSPAVGDRPAARAVAAGNHEDGRTPGARGTRPLTKEELWDRLGRALGAE